MSNKTVTKLGLWATGSLLLALLSVIQSWPEFKNNLSFAYIVGGHHVAPWGVLGLCLVWLVLKRKAIGAALDKGISKTYIVTGVVILVLSYLIPVAADYLVLKTVATGLGLFALLFGRGAMIPMIIFSTYAFTVLFPIFVETYLEMPYALATVIPANWLVNLAGLPVTASGQMFSLLTPTGEEMTVLVASACAGPATMAVFISIFTLMMLDMPAPTDKGICLLLFGVVGTWLQNVLRIIIILTCGTLLGEKALWEAHFWTIYGLFPLWYLVFTAVYFKVAFAPKTLSH